MLPSLNRTALLALPFLLVACGGASSSESGSDSEKAAKSASERTEMTMGADDAPVTVIEYASVTCPGCAAFHQSIFPDIKRDYIDSGKVRFVFREFPTPPQGLSYVGSVLARCAAEKGGDEAYFLVLNSLFQTQRTWIGENAQAELKKIAAQAGMDETAFDTCLQRQDLVDLINQNVEEGTEKYGINATPSFVLNGEKLPAIRSADDMRTHLDEALEASKS